MRMPREPIEWPDGAVLAVIPNVVFETWPEDELGRPGSHQATFRREFPSDWIFTTDVAVVTDRLYGERCGAHRMLEIFDEFDIRTTWFLNGAGVEAFPELAKEILEAGHELASENWRHEYILQQTDQVQKANIERTLKAFQTNLNVRPVGFIAPGDRPNNYTLPLLAEKGYRYYLGMLNEDLPFTIRTESGDLVAFTYGVWMTDKQMAASARTSPRDVLQMWVDQFDQLYEEGVAGRPGLMTMGLHPYIIGRPFRARVVREFLAYATSKPKVWFPRCVEVADHYLANYRESYVERWPFYGTGLPRPATRRTRGG
jgi:peptidoglycan/xylan/chitin deacetylase (PgdA/CDA1 family)